MYHQDWARPEVVALVPTSATRILDVGCNRGALARALHMRQPCEVVGIEQDQSCATWQEPPPLQLIGDNCSAGHEPPRPTRAAIEGVNQLYLMDVERMPDVFGTALPNQDGTRADFDCIVCGDVLEHLHDPAKVLKWLRSLLTDEGVLVLSVPNARYITVAAGLCEGGFCREPAGLLDKTHLQHFTRRELEVLLDGCGYAVLKEQAVKGPGYDEWVDGGRKSEITAGRVKITGLADQEAEEFFIYQWLVVARRKVVKDFGLTSIVIPVCNGLPDTAACLASILKHTPEAIEIIVVDNASTDGTGQWIREKCPFPVTLIRNSENRGFPAACNQGAAAARGKQILFLNNDTLVTPGWLRRMLECLHSDAAVAACGPRTNRAAGAQQMTQHYTSMLELDGWAWGWSMRRWREYLPAHQLIGFCLLVKRDWWERMEGFDEGYGLGNFEDTDLCWRIEQAGGKLLIANDCYIHHEGTKTFQREKIDYNGLLAQNKARFAQKRAGTLATGASPEAPPPSRFAISIVHGTARVAPTENLPRGWMEACEQWYATCDHPEAVEYILVVHESRWAEFWSGALPVKFPAWGAVKVICNRERDCCVDQANAGAAEASGDLLVGGMDDLFAPPGWDRALLAALPDRQAEKVLVVQTGAATDDFKFIPQILSRARYKARGYMLHPSYIGMFADDEFSEVARRDGVAERIELRFEHRHPMFQAAESDEVYERHNDIEAYRQGYENLLRRRAAGFPD